MTAFSGRFCISQIALVFNQFVKRYPNSLWGSADTRYKRPKNIMTAMKERAVNRMFSPVYLRKASTGGKAVLVAHLSETSRQPSMSKSQYVPSSFPHPCEVRLALRTNRTYSLLAFLPPETRPGYFPQRDSLGNYQVRVAGRPEASRTLLIGAEPSPGFVHFHPT